MDHGQSDVAVLARPCVRRRRRLPLERAAQLQHALAGRLEQDNADDEVGVPQWLPSEPGYIRWTPIVGATGYDVWFTNVNEGTGGGFSKIVSTITTVADEREYYTLRAPSQTVEWRVRARRQLYGETQNSLPAVSYGPWSSPLPTIPRRRGSADGQTSHAAEDRVGLGRVRQPLGSGARAHAGVRLLE